MFVQSVVGMRSQYSDVLLLGLYPFNPVQNPDNLVIRHHIVQKEMGGLLQAVELHYATADTLAWAPAVLLRGG